MKIFDLPYLDRASLVGYQLDVRAQKRFEWRFRFPTLVAALLIFGSPLAFFLQKIPQLLTIQLVIVGFALMFASMLRMFKSMPIGAAGRPMKKYWSRHPKAGNTKTIYVHLRGA